MVGVSTLISKVQAGCGGLEHFLLQLKISDVEKSCVLCRGIVEKQSLRAADVWHLEAFDHRCLRTIARIGWNDKMSIT